MYKYVFGPVPSRRLGISLGVDLVKNKRCNFNCIYCECGETESYTEIRDKYIDIERLKEELKEVLKGITPDYITFSGSGEPTLNSQIGEVVKWIKGNYKVKVALITNSSLLHKDDVMEDILDFDLIVPTLNTVIEETFQKINRTTGEIDIEMIKEGFKKLSKRYLGEVNIEFFVIEGINDTKEELDKYIEFLKEIKFSKLQLNSLARKGAEEWVKPVSSERLNEIKEYFEKNGIKNVESIGKIEEKTEKLLIDNKLMENMFEKRDYTEEEIKSIYKIETSETKK